MQIKINQKVILFLLFLFPIIVFLFIKIFGENKFELQIIKKLEFDCLQNKNSLFLKKDYSIDSESKFQIERLKKYSKINNIQLLKDTIDCFNYSEKDLFLVDKENRLRGEYEININEIDRAIVEIDLLLHE